MEDKKNDEGRAQQETAKTPAAPNRAFPFTTKAEVRERIGSDRDFAIECVAIIQERHERRLTGRAGAGASGWMSSHSSLGTRLGAKLANGTATEEEIAEVTSMVVRYSKQIAIELRTLELQRQPELAATAALFGVSPTGAGVAPTVGGKAEPARPVGRRRAVADPPVAADPPPEPEETDEGCDVCARVMDLLRAEDGRRSTDIAEALDTTTLELARHLRDLLDDGSVTKDGHGRGTRYFVA